MKTPIKYSVFRPETLPDSLAAKKSRSPLLTNMSLWIKLVSIHLISDIHLYFDIHFIHLVIIQGDFTEISLIIPFRKIWNCYSVYINNIKLAGTLFAMLFAYYMERRQIPGRNFFDCLVTLPYMLPGTCFGIGYILAFNSPPLKLTGTALIVISNMLFKQLPTATKICSATLTQVPRAQEKAVRDLGGGQLSVLKTVILPGLKPAFLSCFVYNFSSSMTTAGAILFLIDPGRKLAVFKLFDAVYTGDYALASLIATSIILVVLAVEGMAYLITWKAGKRRVS